MFMALVGCGDATIYVPPLTIEEPDQAQAEEMGEPLDLSSAPDMDLPDLVNPPDADSAPDEAPDLPQPLGEGLARSLSISSVDAYQTIQIPLHGGEPVADVAPLIAGRETLIRISATPQPGAQPEAVTAEVIVEGGATPLILRDTKTLTQPSRQDALSSTFNVTIPRGALTPASSLSVRLSVPRQGDVVAPGASHPAAWPAERTQHPLAARADSGALRVVLVPLKYDYDDSGRLPDTSPARVARYEALLRALFPSTDVQISVHEPISWDQSLRFGNINQMLVQLKEDERADDDLYYYALVNPADTFEEYCGRSCTTGQSFTTSNNADGVYRVGSGLGYATDDRLWTLAHELGHMHGRGHAPCDVSFWNADGDYPHGGGLVGVWGWDQRDGSLKDPDEIADMMGYCDDQWLSDYTYVGMFERSVRIAGRNALRTFAAPRAHRFLTIPAQGAPQWGRSIKLRGGHTGDEIEVRLLDAAGRLVGTLMLPRIPTGHDGAQELLVPQLSARVISIEVAGRRISAAGGR
jgi:hypothetical protein